MSVIDDISRACGGRKSTRGNQIGKCPAHEDKNRSFTFKEESGKLLLKCWAGCTFEQIIDALVQKAVIPPLTPSEENQKDGIRLDFKHPDVGSFWAEFDSMDYALIAVYKYRDDRGTLVGFKARFRPKTFRFFTHSGYDRNFPKRALALPYRLPEVLKALEEQIPVHIFEGEKDCENALKLGLEECTSFGSSGDPEPSEYYAKFKNARIVIWADNDKPGLKRAEQIANALYNNGAQVKVVLSPIGKDFSDWMEAGATQEDVGKLLAKTPQWLPSREQMEALAATGEFPRTEYDMGSEAFAAEYISHKFRSELRYAPGFSKWMRHEKVWKLDKEGFHHECAKSLSLTIRRDMEKIDVLHRKALDKLAQKLQTDSGRKAVISTAKTVPALLIDIDHLDNSDSRYLFSCESGVIDLRRGTLLPHSPQYLITKHSPWTVDLEGQPQGFLQFVNQLFHDDAVCQWFLNFLGYCLTGEKGWQHFCMWVGQPGTGKSQVQAIMRSLLGPHCGDIDSSSLVAAKQRTAAVESDLCSAHGTRLVFASELSGQHSLDERVIKCLSGEDVIKVKHMGQDKFPLRANAKLVMTANDRPPLSDDGGIARRLLEVRFERMPENVVLELAEKLLAAEGPQILGYLVNRARKYYDDPSILKPPDTVRLWTEDYIEEVDYVKQWNKACLLFIEGAFTETSVLYESLQKYCTRNHIIMDMKVPMLGRRLPKFGYKPDRTEGRRGWKNVVLRGEG